MAMKCCIHGAMSLTHMGMCMMHMGWNIVYVMHVALRYCVRDAYGNDVSYTWRYVLITHGNVYVAHGMEYCIRDAVYDANGDAILYT